MDESSLVPVKAKPSCEHPPIKRMRAESPTPDVQPDPLPVPDTLSKPRHPINDLFSVELMSQIFLQCLPTSYSRPSIREAPMSLSWVCRSWRNVVLSTPRLWASLKLSLKNASPSSSSWPEVAENWLSRSASLPLRLQIGTYLDGNHFSTELAEVLAKHAHRWEVLKLFIRSSDLLFVLKHRSVLDDGCPILRKLVIMPSNVTRGSQSIVYQPRVQIQSQSQIESQTEPESQSQSSTPPNPHPHPFPALEELILDEQIYVKFPPSAISTSNSSPNSASKLRYLRASYNNIPDIYDAFLHFPSLCRFVFTTYRDGWGPWSSTAPMALLTHRSLHTLHIEDTSPSGSSGLSDLFKRLSLPCLEELRLIWAADGGPSNLDVLLKQSNAPLVRLYVNDISPEELVEALKYVPELQVLQAGAALVSLVSTGALVLPGSGLDLDLGSGTATATELAVDTQAGGDAGTGTDPAPASGSNSASDPVPVPSPPPPPMTCPSSPGLVPSLEDIVFIKYKPFDLDAMINMILSRCSPSLAYPLQSVLFSPLFTGLSRETNVVAKLNEHPRMKDVIEDGLEVGEHVVRF